MCSIMQRCILHLCSLVWLLKFYGNQQPVTDLPIAIYSHAKHTHLSSSTHVLHENIKRWLFSPNSTAALLHRSRGPRKTINSFTVSIVSIFKLSLSSFSEPSQRLLSLNIVEHTMFFQFANIAITKHQQHCCRRRRYRRGCHHHYHHPHPHALILQKQAEYIMEANILRDISTEHTRIHTQRDGFERYKSILYLIL